MMFINSIWLGTYASETEGCSITYDGCTLAAKVIYQRTRLQVFALRPCLSTSRGWPQAKTIASISAPHCKQTFELHFFFRVLDNRGVNVQNYFIFFKKHYAVGTRQNCLFKTNLSSTDNILFGKYQLKIWLMKIRVPNLSGAMLSPSTVAHKMFIINVFYFLLTNIRSNPNRHLHLWKCVSQGAGTYNRDIA